MESHDHIGIYCLNFKVLINATLLYWGDLFLDKYFQILPSKVSLQCLCFRAIFHGRLQKTHLKNNEYQWCHVASIWHIKSAASNETTSHLISKKKHPNQSQSWPWSRTPIQDKLNGNVQKMLLHSPECNSSRRRFVLKKKTTTFTSRLNDSLILVTKNNPTFAFNMAAPASILCFSTRKAFGLLETVEGKHCLVVGVVEVIACNYQVLQISYGTAFRSGREVLAGCSQARGRQSWINCFVAQFRLKRTNCVGVSFMSRR